MLNRILILLVPALAEFGCTIGGRGGDAYEPFPKTVEGWRLHERDKRDFLQVEDIKLGNSPWLAGGGRSELTSKSVIPIYQWNGCVS